MQSVQGFIVANLDELFKRRGTYHFINKVINSFIFKSILIFFAALNAYIMLCLGNEDNANKFKSNLGGFATFILDNGGAIVIFSVVSSSLYVLLTSFISDKCDDYEEKYKDLYNKYDIVINVLEKLENVVVEKRKRFATNAFQFLKAPQTPKHKTVFDKITQPRKQIELLIEALHDCLKNIYPNEIIKVALVEVENAEVKSWVCHSPYDTKPRTAIETLRDPNSTFSKCIEMNKIVIVPNTQKEIKKTNITDRMFIQGKTDPKEIWCQVCAPIHSINNNQIIFIISIAIKKEDTIVENNTEFLEWLLKFFKSRLALEHSLAQLKERIS